MASGTLTWNCCCTFTRCIVRSRWWPDVQVSNNCHQHSPGTTDNKSTCAHKSTNINFNCDYGVATFAWSSHQTTPDVAMPWIYRLCLLWCCWVMMVDMTLMLQCHGGWYDPIVAMPWWLIWPKISVQWGLIWPYISVPCRLMRPLFLQYRAAGVRARWLRQWHPSVWTQGMFS